MHPKEVARDVWAVTGGEFVSNSYICAADVKGGAILIDSGLDPEPIDSALAALGRQPAHVFCTHGHFDHVGSSAYFQKKYDASVHLHRADYKTARSNNFLLMAMKLNSRISLPEFEFIDGAANFEFGDQALTYIEAPGHTPGSCAILFEGNLFTGDTLYTRGVGLSKLPGERPEQLRNSIRLLWPRLAEVIVHPGHGPSANGSDIMSGNAALLRFLEQAHSEAGEPADA